MSIPHSENVYSNRSSEYNSLKIIESFILSYIAHIIQYFQGKTPLPSIKTEYMQIYFEIFFFFFLSILQLCHDLNDINSKHLNNV